MGRRWARCRLTRERYRGNFLRACYVCGTVHTRGTKVNEAPWSLPKKSGGVIVLEEWWGSVLDLSLAAKRRRGLQPDFAGLWRGWQGL